MSQYQSAYVPEGLTRKQTERGCRVKPPVPFVPSSPNGNKGDKEHTVEVTVNKDVKEKVTVFNGGNQESFLWVASNIKGILERQQAKETHAGWLGEVSDADDELQLLLLDISTSAAGDESNEGKEGDDSKANSSTSKPMSSEDEPIPKKQKPDPEARVKVLKEKMANAKKMADKTLKHAADMYSVVLATPLAAQFREELDKVAHKPYTDNKGVQHPPRGLTWDSLELAVRTWLRHQFPDNAAEQEREYLQMNLQYPVDKMTILAFAGRFNELNNQLEFLPCLYDTGESSTPMNVPFVEAEVPTYLLHAFPMKYQNQYRLSNRTTATDVSTFIKQMVKVQRVMQDAQQAKKPSPAEPSPSSSGGRKRSTETPNAGNPTKRTKKHCGRCKRWGGAHNTHNDNDCQKYDSKGNVLSTWKSKSKKRESAKSTHQTLSDYAQTFATLSASVAELKTQFDKQIRRGRHRHGKRHRDDDDSASYGSDRS